MIDKEYLLHISYLEKNFLSILPNSNLFGLDVSNQYFQLCKQGFHCKELHIHATGLDSIHLHKPIIHLHNIMPLCLAFYFYTTTLNTFHHLHNKKFQNHASFHFPCILKIDPGCTAQSHNKDLIAY